MLVNLSHVRKKRVRPLPSFSLRQPCLYRTRNNQLDPSTHISQRSSGMYSFLPDELLKEILAPALRVPDDSFACTSGRSPFSNYNQTTSAYLLVCKDWLRVATPLLYSVVVLRSKAQIQALESAIESTPVLADFIRKLRIESGYCTSLLTILKGAKNLTDLCLSLEVYSSDNVAAIRRGFAFINPTRLIVYDLCGHTHRNLNQKAQQLLKSTHEYVEKWDKLVRRGALPFSHLLPHNLIAVLYSFCSVY